MNSKFNKFIYIAFLFLGTYQAIFNRNFLEAASSFGIGLAFDPFDTTVTWKKRQLWQKIVLFSHLGITAAMFGFGIGLNDK
jgi:hypothetical protein